MASSINIVSLNEDPNKALATLVYDYLLKLNHVSAAAAFIVEAHISSVDIENLNNTTPILLDWFRTFWSVYQHVRTQDTKNPFIASYISKLDNSNTLTVEKLIGDAKEALSNSGNGQLGNLSNNDDISPKDSKKRHINNKKRSAGSMSPKISSEAPTPTAMNRNNNNSSHPTPVPASGPGSGSSIQASVQPPTTSLTQTSKQELGTIPENANNPGSISNPNASNISNKPNSISLPPNNINMQAWQGNVPSNNMPPNQPGNPNAPGPNTTIVQTPTANVATNPNQAQGQGQPQPSQFPQQQMNNPNNIQMGPLGQGGQPPMNGPMFTMGNAANSGQTPVQHHAMPNMANIPPNMVRPGAVNMANNGQVYMRTLQGHMNVYQQQQQQLFAQQNLQRQMAMSNNPMLLQRNAAMMRPYLNQMNGNVRPSPVQAQAMHQHHASMVDLHRQAQAMKQPNGQPMGIDPNQMASFQQMSQFGNMNPTMLANMGFNANSNPSLTPKQPQMLPPGSTPQTNLNTNNNNSNSANNNNNVNENSGNQMENIISNLNFNPNPNSMETIKQASKTPQPINSNAPTPANVGQGNAQNNANTNNNTNTNATSNANNSTVSNTNPPSQQSNALDMNYDNLFMDLGVLSTSQAQNNNNNFFLPNTTSQPNTSTSQPTSGNNNRAETFDTYINDDDYIFNFGNTNTTLNPASQSGLPNASNTSAPSSNPNATSASSALGLNADDLTGSLESIMGMDPFGHSEYFS